MQDSKYVGIYEKEMKKVLIFIFGCALLCACGNHPTPEEAARRSLERDMQELEQNQMSHERYIDSLVNVASGLDGATLRSNRQHALDILRREYPELNERWDAVQKSIDNLEMY